METPTRNSPPPSDGIVAVAAVTLQEAYRRVKREYGDEAVIVGSRSVSRREDRGLGQSRFVEVLVQTGNPVPVTTPVAGGRAPAGLAAEVERIEDLVAAIEKEHARLRSIHRSTTDPLTEALVASGASEPAVNHLLTRFTSETGRLTTDRTAALSWLEQNLLASNSDWNGFYGCHAFLGPSGSGRTELVLEAARKLQQHNRRTLVLSIQPAHRGEVRRLQTAAAAGGFDAAVIQKTESVASVAEHLGDYDAVLLDLPDLDGSAGMEPGQELHRWLATNDGFHRHLVLPLDGDPRDQADLAPLTRTWNCDWLALTNTGRTRRWGKVLDLQRSLSLPLSLLAAESIGDAPRIAVSGQVLDHILGAVDHGETTVAAMPMTDAT